MSMAEQRVVPPNAYPPVLKGYMFLTPRRICFFARLADDESAVIKSGPLWKKSSRTKLSTKFWFLLRNDVLSWYESSTVGTQRLLSLTYRIHISPKATYPCSTLLAVNLWAVPASN